MVRYDHSSHRNMIEVLHYLYEPWACIKEGTLQLREVLIHLTNIILVSVITLLLRINGVKHINTQECVWDGGGGGTPIHSSGPM